MRTIGCFFPIVLALLLAAASAPPALGQSGTPEVADGAPLFTVLPLDAIPEFRQLRVEGGDLLMTDAQTGSTWRALEGVAVAGKLKGQRFGHVAGTTAFWFAWKQIYP